MRWVLFASLALNLLIVGVVAGALISGGPRTKGPPGERMTGAPYVSAFERADKRAIRAQMRKQLPPRREMIAKNKADYAAFVAVLRAGTFDQERAREIMERQMDRSLDTLRLGRALALDQIAQMTANERAAYATRLEERAAQFGKRGPRQKDR